MNNGGGDDLQSLIASGHFASKQVCGKVWLISWSHRRRFQIALRLARGLTGGRILDYGCGDGTFLALLAGERGNGVAAVGAERDIEVVEDCRARFARFPVLTFVQDVDLMHGAHAGAYDAVFCMEVLEHVLDMDALLGLFERLLSPTGRLFISVPVETGIPILVKQSVRRMASWVKLYSPPSRYTTSELVRSVFASADTRVPRIVYPGREGRSFYDHKGFNWMAMRRTLEGRFDLERIVASPVTWFSPHLASQVWFIARRRA